MMPNPRKLILYIAMSLDGFIADENENLDFLGLVEKEGEDYGYAAFTQSVDTVIIGRKTFDKVKEMGFDYPHTDKKVYIISRSKKPSMGAFEYYTGDLASLVHKLKSEPGKNMYCDGGAEIANALLQMNLLDEIIISVIPVLLGGGVRLFQNHPTPHTLTLLNAQSYEKGLVQLHYAVKH